MIHEHDRVVLTLPLSGECHEAGDVGTVVHVYPRDEAYEIELPVFEWAADEREPMPEPKNQ